MSTEEHQVNLYARYEQRLLSGSFSKPHVIPAVVITGFLGSGKTTLVHHILRNRGDLRIALLVNEVGQLDVDSQLVNAKQGNAALGLPAVDLSGGCVCCSRAEDLAEALRSLRAPQQAATATAARTGGGWGLGRCSSSASCDYLLVETSGAADAGPLAEALVAGGFRLDAVVAVVDAEAGREALRHPVAHAQITCADVVVLNKCDLVAPGLGGGGGGGLGALADMEDLLAEMAPGVRIVRARYGEVPLTAVLDVEPVGPGDGGSSSSGTATAAAAPAPAPPSAVGGDGNGGSAGGAIAVSSGGASEVEGFMSHESVPSLVPRGAGSGSGIKAHHGPRTAEGMTVGSSRHTKRRMQTRPVTPTPTTTTTTTTTTTPAPAPTPTTTITTGVPTATSHQHHQDHHHHYLPDHHHQHHHNHPGPGLIPRDHSVLHSGFYTESVRVAEGPRSLVAFAAFVVDHLVKEPALLRSKGVLWFGERRLQRFIFHLSGRRRVELAQEGPWEGPPASQLVLIGTDAAAMTRLKEAFLRRVTAAAAAVAGLAAAGRPLALVPTRVVSRSGADADKERRGADGGSGGGGGVEAAGTGGGVSELLEAAAVCITAEERLELLGCEHWGEAEVAAEVVTATADTEGGDGGGGDGRAGCGGGLLHFTARGSVLHGINPEDLNGELMRRANASGLLLLAAVTAPGKVSSVTHLQSRDRVLSLLLPCSLVEAQEQAALCVKSFAEPLLRKAYAHVHNCKCDVAASMQTFST